MPHYYFNVLDGKSYWDREGVDAPSLGEAESEAMKAAGEIVRDGNFPDEEWAMNIVDEDGKVLKTIRVSAGGSASH